MAYLINCFDKPGAAALRQQTREEHLAYLTKYADIVLLAGAKWTDDGQTALGSVLVVDLDTREEAEDFAAADPYSRVGLFEDVRITYYRVAFLDHTNRLPA